MKKANPITLSQALGLALVATIFATNAFAAGLVDPAKPSSPARANLDASLAREASLSGKSRMVEISQKLNIPSAELVSFFKAELAARRGNKRAWSELMVFVTTKPRAGATQADFQHVNLASEALSSYIVIRNSKVIDNLTVRETDLVEVQKSWTVEQKTNFNKVLRRAAVLAKTGRFNTLEDVFNQALTDTGYAAKYNSCRI